MLEINELNIALLKLLDKTAADTKPINAIAKDIGDESIAEPIRIKFNRNYFATVKLLETIFAQQYKEERGALFVNEALVKFSYLAQMFLNCFCLEATLYADNIDYNCFELSIFYVALLNLAKQLKFGNLVNKLEQIHLDIFKHENHPSAYTSLINTDIEIYKKRFYQEIILFEKQFFLHYEATAKGKITYTYNLDPNSKVFNFKQLLDKLCYPRLHSYHQQLILRLIQFNFIDPISNVAKTKQIIDDMLKPENPPQEVNNRQKKLATACQQYEETLLDCLPKIRPNISNLIESNTFLFSSNYDPNYLIIKFNFLYGVKFNKTKIAAMKSCQFLSCDFSNTDLEDIAFTNCTFLGCDFSNLTLSGVFINCRFEKCNFSGAHLVHLQLHNSIFKDCNLNKTDWYRVSVTNHTQIVTSSFIDAAIRFSDLDKAEILQNNLTRASFEGTRVNMISGQRNTWDDASLDGALYLAKIAANPNELKEHLHANIDNKLQSLFENLERCSNVLISTGDLTSALKYIIEEDKKAPIDFSDDNPNKHQRFKRFLGWILCAVDHLIEYCNHYVKNQATFNFKNSITNFEILADTLKTALTIFKYRYLSLYDMCHLSLITESTSVHGRFYTHKQYQAALFKILKADPNFASNPIGKDDLFHKKKKNKEQSLVIIQKLPNRLNDMHAIFSVMRNQMIEEEKQRLVENNQSENNLQPPQSIRSNAS